MTPDEALSTAIDVCGGTPSALAQALGGGLVRQNVEHWIAAKAVPAKHCPSIERETVKRGKPVRCEDLNPDVDWSVLRGSKPKARKAALVR